MYLLQSQIGKNFTYNKSSHKKFSSLIKYLDRNRLNIHEKFLISEYCNEVSTLLITCTSATRLIKLLLSVSFPPPQRKNLWEKVSVFQATFFYRFYEIFLSILKGVLRDDWGITPGEFTLKFCLIKIRYCLNWVIVVGLIYFFQGLNLAHVALKISDLVENGERKMV